MTRARLPILLLPILLAALAIGVWQHQQGTTAATARLPVKVCNYTNGLPDGIQAPHIPASQPTFLAADKAANLASYAVPSRSPTPALYVVAPRGWHCAAVFGANGSIGITVTPRPPAQAGFALPHAPLVAASIEGNGNAIYDGCNVFPDFEAQATTDGYPCPIKSTAELATRNGDTVAVIDTSGVKGSVPGSGGQTRAIGWFSHQASTYPSLVSLACDLPAKTTRICPVILQQDWRPLLHAYGNRFTPK
jgi:hypothetical protein